HGASYISQSSFQCTLRTRRLHSFPTRRSSDLRGPEGFHMLTAAMAELENFGWCWVQEWSAGGPKSWCVDARIHERFANMAERVRSEEHTSELQSRENLVCRLLLEKKKQTTYEA